MNFSDDIEINFDILPTDAMGRNGMSGKLRLLEKMILIDYRQKRNAFRKNDLKIKTIELTYGQVSKIIFKKSWFSQPKILFSVTEPRLIADLAQKQLGTLQLVINPDCEKDAKNLEKFIDFKVSELKLTKIQKKLAEFD